MKPLYFMIVVATVLILIPACSDEGIVEAGRPQPEVAGPPVLRSEAVMTADRYARVHWTMTDTNRRGVTCGNYFASVYPVGDRIGVGYKWGGWTQVDTFLEKIELGYGTGTGGYVQYDDFPIDCVVGVSCTGLVSRAWNLDEKYTLCYEDLEIENKFCEICEVVEGVDFATYETSALKKGDAFVSATHSILFIYETKSRKPMIIDSSYPGVKFRQMSWGGLGAEGYIPLRYNNIVDDSEEVGTIINPIVIEDSDLPVEIEGNTRNVVSMEFDYYSTESAVREFGPEVIYELHLDEYGTVNIFVTEVKIEGINNNVALLSSLALDQSGVGVDCIASHDNSISQLLNAGTWYIIVDSGNDTPGEYTLRVSVERD